MPIWGTLQIGELLGKMNKNSIEISLSVDKETPFDQINYNLRWAYYFVKVLYSIDNYCRRTRKDKCPYEYEVIIDNSLTCDFKIAKTSTKLTVYEKCSHPFNCQFSYYFRDLVDKYALAIFNVHMVEIEKLKKNSTFQTYKTWEYSDPRIESLFSDIRDFGKTD